MREADNALRKLSRQLSTMRSQHQELVSAHSAAGHASEMARLDTQKFRTAKAASDLEMETERLSGQLADMAARLQELELQGVEGAPAAGAAGDEGGGGLVEDEVLLRLKVYRSLGIDVERDAREGGVHARGGEERPEGRCACCEPGQEVLEVLLCQLLLADAVSDGRGHRMGVYALVLEGV